MRRRRSEQLFFGAVLAAAIVFTTSAAAAWHCNCHSGPSGRTCFSPCAWEMGGGGGGGSGGEVVDPGPAAQQAANELNQQADVVWNRRDWVNAIHLKQQVLQRCSQLCSKQFTDQISQQITRASKFAAIVSQAHQLNQQANEVWNRRDWENAVRLKQEILQKCRPNADVNYCPDEFTDQLSGQIAKASKFAAIVSQAHQLNQQANEVWNRRDWENAGRLKREILQKCKPNADVTYCTDEFTDQLSDQIARASKFAETVSQAMLLNTQADQFRKSEDWQNAIRLKQQVLQKCGADTAAIYCPEAFIGDIASQIAGFRVELLSSQATAAWKQGDLDTAIRLKEQAVSQCGGACSDSWRKKQTDEIAMLHTVNNIKLIRSATANHQQPPFQPVWHNYEAYFEQHIGKGLAPDQNACAITLSLTLGLEPGAGEHSIADLANPGMRDRFVGALKDALPGPGSVFGPHTASEVTDAQIAKRYYIRAEELAGRLRKEWGTPVELETSQARAYIQGKKGVIVLVHAYREASHFGERAGDHIDVWNGAKLGSNATLPLEQAEKVWFWEFDK